MIINIRGDLVSMLWFGLVHILILLWNWIKPNRAGFLLLGLFSVPVIPLPQDWAKYQLEKLQMNG